MKQFKRSGDHSFHSVEKIPNGKKISHSCRYIFGIGEKSSHNHIITVEREEDMIIRQADNGVFYFELKTDGVLTHEVGDSRRTADHQPIKIRTGFYVHIPEREVDLFSSVIRKVID